MKMMGVVEQRVKAARLSNVGYEILIFFFFFFFMKHLDVDDK